MASELLLHATNQGDVEQCQCLILEGLANINITNTLGDTCVHIATSRSLYSLLEVLLSFGADPNVTQHAQFGGRSPLHIAVGNSDLRAAELLLAWHGDPNLIDVDGAQPLHDAAQLGHVAMCKLLMSHGSRVDVVDNTGKTPYYYAARKNYVDVMALLPPSKYKWKDQRDAMAKRVVWVNKSSSSVPKK